MRERSDEGGAVRATRPRDPGEMAALVPGGIVARADASAPRVLRAYVLARRRLARRALDSELTRALAGAGFDASDLCARELTAELADIGVGELLQVIANNRRDATIDLFHGACISRVWCAGGQIVDAVSGRLAGEPAVYRILALERGELVADFRPVRRPRVITNTTLSLMLEASRRKDECAVLERRLGGAERAYREVAEARASFDAEGLEAALLAAFGRGARVESVLAQGSLDDLSMLQAIAKLVDQGALVAVDPTPPLELSAPPLEAPLLPAPPPPAEAQGAARLRPTRCSVVFVAAASGLLAVLALLFRTNAVELWRAFAAGDEREDRRALTPAPAARRAPASGPSPGEASTPAAPTYPLQVFVEPGLADIWLDGAWMARGELAIRLNRDGQTHELRVAASDHQPQTLLFRDTPPPLVVRLLPTIGTGAVDGAPRSGGEPPHHSGTVR